MAVHSVSFEPLAMTNAVPEEETVLLSGEAERGKHSIFALKQEEMLSGHVLLCRIRPRSDLVLHLLRVSRREGSRAGLPAVQTRQRDRCGHRASLPMEERTR